MKKKLLESDKKFIWHPFTQSKTSIEPILITSSKGDKLKDIDGKEYVDLISSWWVNIHGHSKLEICKKIFRQSIKLDQVIFADCTHPPAINLAKNLVDLLPKNLNRVFYSDNGSTSVEIALKVAYQYWHNKSKKRKKIVAFKGGYHGDTLGAMSVGFSTGFYEPFKDLLFKPEFIPYPENWRGNNRIDEQEIISIKKVDELINKDGDDIAAIIIEPLVQGASGMKMCRPEYLDKIVKKFQENGTLVIFDEVMTGFGRTGKMFALEYIKHSPDIVCLAKSLTGGYLPLAATIFKEFIHKEFVDVSMKKTFLHGHSFSANPIACSAAIESLNIFKKENTLKKVNEIEKVHFDGLNYLSSNSMVSKTRYLGGIAAFDVVGFDQGYGAKVGEKIKKLFLQKGLLIRPLGQTVYLMPIYSTNTKFLYKVYEYIDEVMLKIKNSQV